MQVEKVGRLEILVASLRSRNDTLATRSMGFVSRLKLMVQRHLEQKIKNSHFKEINRDEDRPASGVPSKVKTKGKGKYNAKKTTPRVETAHVGSREANVHLEIRAR